MTAAIDSSRYQLKYAWRELSLSRNNFPATINLDEFSKGWPVAGPSKLVGSPPPIKFVPGFSLCYDGAMVAVTFFSWPVSPVPLMLQNKYGAHGASATLAKTALGGNLGGSTKTE
jgi:hypothetical protein